MEQDMSEQREILSARAEIRIMNSPDAVATNVQTWLRAIADTFGRVSLKETFMLLARATSLTVGQVKRLWYGEWHVIPAHVFLAIAKAYRSAINRAQAFADHQKAIWTLLNQEWDETWGDCLSPCEPGSPAGVASTHTGAHSP